jgi:hypothetical protein
MTIYADGGTAERKRSPGPALVTREGIRQILL